MIRDGMLVIVHGAGCELTSGRAMVGVKLVANVPLSSLWGRSQNEDTADLSALCLQMCVYLLDV